MPLATTQIEMDDSGMNKGGSERKRYQRNELMAGVSIRSYCAFVQ